MKTTTLDNLNPAQREAVSAENTNLLILAGAGSGKTRVLVHRIAWLTQELNVSPYAILAVTFTNKAANEMRGRIESLIGMPTQGMWIGTFHGLAHRLLRAHFKEAGLPQAFQILDGDDQYRLIRRVMKNLNIDEERYPPRQVQSYINTKKDEGLRPQHLDNRRDVFEKMMLELYSAYEEICQREGLVDFAELLLRSHELWLKNPTILKHYQQRFEHILVDEFQDTNTIQYAWLRILTHQNNRIMIVGDDDQSIYGWRGAKVENIQRFQKDFPNTKVIRLEQNYRSTGNILKAANALIEKNEGRLGKNLWTEDGDGDPISLYTAYNDRDEANHIVNRILDWFNHGNNYRECAILYRSNAQSRVLEETLIQLSIPYRVYGGLRFFERAEIKDALAYLRIISNHNDDSAFERIVNVPTRGIGDRTLSIAREYARDNHVSMWQASQTIIQENKLPARATAALLAFIHLIEQLSSETHSLILSEQIEQTLQTSDLLNHYRKEKGEKGQARIDNLEELINASQQYEAGEEENLTPLQSFLSHAALEAGDNQADKNSDCVQLMTLHAAKGLEFPIVFLTGLEENLFPHQLSSREEGRLEEERRLCYVGMTRAMKKLHLSHAQTRRLHGNETLQSPSRFLYDIPSKYIEEVRMRTKVSKPISFETTSYTKNPCKSQNDTGFKLGQLVQHPTFGLGVILNIEDNGPKAHIAINFKKVGTKRLLAEFAKLEKV